jgi:hypothetical protein
MKKILLLLVSGLILAGMAGAALAQQSYLVDAQGTKYQDLGNPYTIPVGNTIFIGFQITNVDYQNEHGTYPLVIEITRTSDNVKNPPEIQVTPDITSFDVDQASFPDNKAVQTYHALDIKALPGSENYVYHVTVSTATGSTGFDLGAKASNNFKAVPEFPTVALPVAAILGLVFVFGRKKGDL